MSNDAGGSGERDEEEDARAFILARRARFVTAALAGVSLATVACECGPQVCLEPAVPPGSGGSAGSPDAGPQPCLTPVALAETGGAGGAGGSAGGASGGAGGQP